LGGLRQYEYERVKIQNFKVKKHKIKK
jgi:hypothetical protein